MAFNAKVKAENNAERAKIRQDRPARAPDGNLVSIPKKCSRCFKPPGGIILVRKRKDKKVLIEFTPTSAGTYFGTCDHCRKVDKNRRAVGTAREIEIARSDPNKAYCGWCHKAKPLTECRARRRINGQRITKQRSIVLVSTKAGIKRKSEGHAPKKPPKKQLRRQGSKCDSPPLDGDSDQDISDEDNAAASEKAYWQTVVEDGESIPDPVFCRYAVCKDCDNHERERRQAEVHERLKEKKQIAMAARKETGKEVTGMLLQREKMVT